MEGLTKEQELKKEEELRRATNEILEITEKLKDKTLSYDGYVELLKQSKDAFEKALKATKELIEFKEAKREDERKQMSQEDKVGGRKRESRKRSSSKKRKTRRKQRR
jgi:hypothetical protein